MHRALLLCLASLCVLVSAGCFALDDQCPDGMDPFTEFNVYFGQEKGDGSSVTAEEWAGFLADTVTPRFPDGLTVLDARGQWFDADALRLYREDTRVLNVLVPSDSADAALASVREISDVYKTRFQQQAVFLTSLPACAAVH